MFRGLMFRLRGLVQRRRVARELDDELQFHVDMEVRRRVSVGQSPDEARRAACLAFGGVAQTKEAVHDVRAFWPDILWQDLRHALRSCHRDKAFAITTALTLAVGIGVNAAVFGLVDAVLIRRLPYPSPERIVRIHGWSGQAFIRWGGETGFAVSPPELAASRAFVGIGVAVPAGLNLGMERPDRIRAAVVTPGFFEALGARPTIGRLFSEEDVRRKPELAVISDRLWRTRFAADPNLVGQLLRLNGRQFVVTGVMPPRVEYPNGCDAWVASAAEEGMDDRPVPVGLVVARLAPGVSTEQARDEFVRFSRARRSDSKAAQQTTVLTLRDELVGGVRPVLTFIWCGAFLLLLVTCINAAHLLLARLGGREREFAVRRALGASRAQLVRHLLAETVVLAGTAVVLAIPVVAWTLSLVGALVPPTLHGASDIGIDARVLAATGTLALVTVLVCGLVPAFALPGRDAGVLLRSAGGATSDRFWRRFRSAMVVAEIAFAVALLVGAGTIVRTVSALIRADIGAANQNALAFDVMLPDTSYPSRRARALYFERLQQQLRAQPQVVAAGGTDQLPGDPDDLIVTPNFRVPNSDPRQRAYRVIATPGYFDAAGIARIAGRSFSTSDTIDSPEVVVVNQRVCAMVGLSAQAIVGRRVSFDDRRVEVVGVVGDVRLYGAEEERSIPICYVPNSQSGFSHRLHMVVQGRVGVAALASLVRATCARVDPSIPVYGLRTLADVKASRFADRRFAMTGTVVFSALALALSIIGLYGVLTHLVQQRTREIGVRMALGASMARLRWSVLTSGAQHAAAGIVAGIACGLGLWKVAATQVPGVGRIDAQILAAVSGMLLVVALAATWIPARRATRVSPVDALRAE